MQNAGLDEPQAGIKTARISINNFRYVDDTTLMAESKKSTKEPLDEVKVQFSRSVVSNSLRPHEPQHARPPCPSPTPGVHPNPCPSSQWCHPIISSSIIPFSSCPQFFPAALRIRWPKCWSFSFNISPSYEHPGLIPFRMDWLDLLADQRTLKSSPVWDEWNSAIVWAFFDIAFLWDWNEHWPFPVLWPLWSFPYLLAHWVQHFHSVIVQDLK